MSNSELQFYVLLFLGSFLFLVAFLAIIFAPKGRFERIDPGRKRKDIIVLQGFGPFYSAKVEVEGGFFEYSGYWFFGRSYMTRRDFGVELLINQGYPKEIAKLRDSKISAKLVLWKKATVAGDPKELVLVFTPYKVGFTHQPPRITKVHLQKKEIRIYREF